MAKGKPSFEIEQAPGGTAVHTSSAELMAEVPVMVRLADIDADAITQVREGTSADTIERYADLFAQGVVLPPLRLRRLKDQRLVLGDGAHRYNAAVKAGLKELPAIIKPGTIADALLDGLKGNREHGLPLTGRDRANAVRKMLRDPTLGTWAFGKIATEVGLSRARVSQLAAELTSKGLLVKPDVRVGADGREINAGAVAAAQRERAAQKTLFSEAERASPPREPMPAAPAPAAPAPLAAVLQSPPREERPAAPPRESGAATVQEHLEDNEDSPLVAVCEGLDGWSQIAENEGISEHDQVKLLLRKALALGHLSSPNRRVLERILRHPLQEVLLHPYEETALWHVLHTKSQAGPGTVLARWTELQDQGGDDGEVLKAMQQAMGPHGKTTGRFVRIEWKGGRSPEVRFYRVGSEDPPWVLQGQDLLSAVRVLMCIPRARGT